MSRREPVTTDGVELLTATFRSVHRTLRLATLPQTFLSDTPIKAWSL